MYWDSFVIFFFFKEGLNISFCQLFFPATHAPLHSVAPEHNQALIFHRVVLLLNSEEEGYSVTRVCCITGVLSLTLETDSLIWGEAAAEEGGVASMLDKS